MFKQVEKEWTLDELTSKFFFDTDIVITDGYTDENKPKVKVLAAKAEDDIQIPESDLVSVVAVNPDILIEQDKIPKFSLEEIDKLADLIEARFLKEGL
jgi:molybdopterin-guanine dinucleotide biosynthesis protein